VTKWCDDRTTAALAREKCAPPVISSFLDRFPLTPTNKKERKCDCMFIVETVQLPFLIIYKIKGTLGDLCTWDVYLWA
jgi:hypothetical protein